MYNQAGRNLDHQLASLTASLFVRVPIPLSLHVRRRVLRGHIMWDLQDHYEGIVSGLIEGNDSTVLLLRSLSS